MAKRHTAGPWIIFIGDDEFLILPAGRDGEVAKVRLDADARLIAAAPDMLAALHIVATQLTTIDNICNEEACDAVRDAIAKAEGK